MDANAFVLDLGTGSLKADIAGTEVPQIYDNLIGKVKYNSLIPDQTIDNIVNGNTFVSRDASKHRGLLSLSYPMDHGHITNWDDITNVFKHVIHNAGISAKDHPLLVTEAPFTRMQQRSKLAQIIFEELQFPSLLFSVQGLLSLYSTGNTTGVVLDIGDGVTQVCPVYQGYSIRDATQRLDIGGRDITKYLKTLLRQNGTFLDSSSEFEIIRDIKEQHVNLQRNAKKELNQINPLSSLPIHTANSTTLNHHSKYKLPDGSELVLGEELELAPQLLFNPLLIGKDSISISQAVNESISSSDIDMRRQLYESIYVSGGTSLIQGFCPRLVQEIIQATPKDCKIKIHAAPERIYQTWTGGSFLAQLSSFKDMLVTKAQYMEEGGDRLIHNKLFH